MHRLAAATAAALVLAAGCSVVNVAEDPVDPTPVIPTGGSGGTTTSSTSSTTTSSTSTSSSTTSTSSSTTSTSSSSSGGSGGGSPDCADGQRNGDETDVDCGGSCDPCELGQECLLGEDCGSGFCPGDDLVCCDGACDGPCEACRASKTGGQDGACGSIEAGTDPDTECAADPVAQCGSSGAGCDGSGACLLYPDGTQCGDPICANGVAISAALCDGAGTCVAGSQSSCGLYACNTTSGACWQSCSDDDHCASPATCNVAGGYCRNTVTFNTHNFAGYTEYPLDTDVCQCCGGTTTAETAQAFCVLAGMTSAVSWTTGTIYGTNCYCWDCITNGTWASNCCGGAADRPMILTVTCE